MLQTTQQITASLFERELSKLHQEISSYSKESQLWIVQGEIANSAGNLALHLCGNLQHYIGAVLGDSRYQRNRSHEFSARHVSKSLLLNEINTTRSIVVGVLNSLTEDSLHSRYPENVLGYEMTTEYFLFHLLNHFGYHLGQINYHRRLIC